MELDLIIGDLAFFQNAKPEFTVFMHAPNRVEWSDLKNTVAQ
jgi:hypothetical protein